MSRYYCDLHIHSCLSPCGDEDMTPGNIVGMAQLNGLGIIALTDHNSTKNCPAFFKIAKANGIIPVAGMELTTAEDVHVVCLFRNLEDAMAFGEFVESKRIRIRNRPDVFGNQQITDENDEVCGEEPNLLINAVDLSIDEAYDEVQRRGGVCYPAHIDRESGGLIAVLGTFPEEPVYTAFELNCADSFYEYKEKHPVIKDKRYVVSSDAHNLWSISEAENSLELDDEPYSSAKVRCELIKLLRGD